MTYVGISDWRAKRHMQEPVRGVFRVSGFYDKHPNSSSFATQITGVIVAPGVPATPAEHKTDERGRWAGVQELPVLVDRADPSRFAILWDEVHPESAQDLARRQAQEQADRLNSAAPGRLGPRVVSELPKERATAVITGVTEVQPPGGMPPGGIADLTFEITRADGSVSTTRTRAGFSSPERRAMVATPGKQLNVFVDPANPARVAIDTDGL
jgi:hypothetical protein